MKCYEMQNPAAETGEILQFRLTSRALSAYCKAHGIEGANPTVSVLSAVDDLDKQAALFRAALNWPDNQNSIRDGYELIDALVDAGWSDIDRQVLVANIALSAGLWNGEADDLLKSVKTGAQSKAKTIAALISGKSSDEDDAETDNTEDEENPTPAGK